MDTKRQERIGRQLQKDLGEIFLEMARQTQGVMISVTNVRVTSDLSLARIYLSIFPAGKVDATLEWVKEQAKTIRFELGKRVRHQLRVVPELSFFIDDSLDYIDNIDRLLKQNQ